MKTTLFILTALLFSTTAAFASSTCQGDGKKSAKTCFSNVRAEGAFTAPNGTVTAIPRLGSIGQAGAMLEDVYKDLERIRGSYCETNKGEVFKVSASVSLLGENGQEAVIANKTREAACKK